MPPTVRLATLADTPALEALIPASARALSQGFYTPAQTEAAIKYVFGVNRQLIEDGTYFVVAEGPRILACGGWSFRDTLYGGDQRPVGPPAAPPAPGARPAKIRAVFVAPGQARRGLGGLLMAACADAAAAAGFQRLELMSTLPGVPFYTRLGFQPVEPVEDTLPDGTVLGFVRMTRPVRVGASTAS